ncbi:YciI family protein [Bacillus pseudomycoides]|uniref:YciI family protein n=1 Tax=Bacillus bingmayongensis TaxID=1150157 RepID=A0ABU5JZP4_9BACI|nr:YciI family protein [Bacillus pseudomycoides]
MQDLFLSLLYKQPSALIFYGGPPPRNPNDPPPKKKLMLERDTDKGLSLTSRADDEWPRKDPENPVPKRLLLQEKPDGRGTTGPRNPHGPPPPTKPMLERDEGKGLTLTSEAGYEISPDKNRYIVTYREMTNMSENENLADQHVTYLRQLIEQGKLIMAGAYASGNQGMMVLSASSLEEAALIIEADPIFQTGYYTKADIDELL